MQRHRLRIQNSRNSADDWVLAKTHGLASALTNFRPMPSFFTRFSAANASRQIGVEKTGAGL